MDIKGIDGQVIGRYNPNTDTIEKLSDEIQNTQDTPIEEDDDVLIQEGGKSEDCSLKMAKMLGRNKKMPEDNGVIFEYPMAIMVGVLGLIIYSLR